LDDKQILEFRDFLVHLVAIAAAVATPYFRTPVVVESKMTNGYDPVTAADRTTEDALRIAISRRYPDHGIAGEERDAVNPSSRFQWVIDPIDGTKAFVCGLPTWSTLIALCDGSVPILGVMSQPIVGEYFISGLSIAEQVSSRGRQRLATSSTAQLRDASLFATSPDMFTEAAELQGFSALSDKVRLTRFGVDSYAYCMLAAGFIDIVAEAGLGFYDIAALVPIIEQSGGIITTWTGEPVRQGGTVLAAANRSLHDGALALLRDARD
jgi:histidinol phosphatase-like enzyme (inositol monophosphatase family)